MSILINEKGIKIFQLSKNETRVLNTLYKSSKPLILAQIARASKIPKTTLPPILKKLKERGFIDHGGPTSQRWWTIESEDNIKYLLENFLSSEPSAPPWSPSSPGYQP